MAIDLLLPNILPLAGSNARSAASADSAAAIKAAGDPIIPVWRVVDPAELRYVQAHGNYGSSPSQSGKYFALTLAGAQAFASAPMNSGSAITATGLPQSVVNSGFMVNDPGQYGAGSSVFFAERQLPTVYGAMTLPVILSKPGP
jgi:hypothetical protein